MKRGALILFLLAYLGAAAFYTSQKTVRIDPDGASRGVFAVMLKEITFGGGVLETVRKFNSHYQVGLEPVFQWSPLQVVFLYLISLIVTNYQFAFSLLNLPIFLLLILYIYRLVMLLFADERTAVFSSLILSLHPLVFDTVFSLRRGLGETLFLVMASCYFVSFLRRWSSKDLLSAFISFLSGVLYRETMAVPLVIFSAFAIYLYISRRREDLFSKEDASCGRSRVFLSVILCAIIAAYVMVQIPLTRKGVGTLLTKGTNYKRWGEAKANIKGLVTMDDYFSVLAVYPILRFDRDTLDNMEREADPFLRKVRLIESRFSLPIGKKAFFILSTIFYQWYLLPFFISGVFLCIRMCRVRYAVPFLVSVFMGYFVLLSMTGTIPDFSLPMIPFVAICSAASLVYIFQLLPRIIHNTAVLFISMVLAVHTAHASNSILFGQKIDACPSRVLGYLLRDSGGKTPFTVLLDSYVEPIYSLAAAELDHDGVIYLKAAAMDGIDSTSLAGWLKRGGFSRMTNLLGKAEYPEVKYILAIMPEEMRHYSSLAKEDVLQFRLKRIISEKDGSASEYIYKR